MANCPSCGRMLRNGQRSPIIHEPEDIEAFKNGQITMEEFDSRAYRNLTRVCPSKSIPELEGKPCPQFGKVVETIKIFDK